MDRVNRVRIIREVARSLEDMRWEESRMLLRSFGFSTDDESYSTPFQFYLDSLGSLVDDQDLLDLHRHLFAESPAAGSSEGDLSAPLGRWPPNAFRLFLSHVSVDKEFMAELKRCLEWWDVAAFVAHADIEPTKEWIEEIELALATCDALMAYLTPTFSDSRWCDQEVGYCVGRRVLIVPVRAGLDPYGFIGRYQAVQGGGLNAYSLADRLIEVLVAHPSTNARMASCLTRRLETSGSYDGTRRVMALIERIQSWSPDLLRRLEAAAQHNDQVSAAIMPNGQPVPDRVRELLVQFGS